MFRPYNLTSIAAWTFGSLAANAASSRTRGSSRRSTLKKLPPAPSILRINQKLEMICNEINRLGSDFCSSARATETGKIGLTPLIRLIAYYEWFQTRKETIKTETRNAFTEAMASGYVWGPNEVKNAEASIDSISDYLNDIIDGMRKAIDTMPSLKNEEHQMILAAMKERQSTCRVNDSTYKLIDSNSGRLFIRGKN